LKTFLYESKRFWRQTKQNSKNQRQFYKTIIFSIVRKILVLKQIENMRSGVNFINVLCTAFTLIDPESVKRYWWLNCIFCAFGIYERKSCMLNVDEIDLCLTCDTLRSPLTNGNKTNEKNKFFWFLLSCCRNSHDFCRCFLKNSCMIFAAYKIMKNCSARNHANFNSNI